MAEQRYQAVLAVRVDHRRPVDGRNRRHLARRDCSNRSPLLPRRIHAGLPRLAGADQGRRPERYRLSGTIDRVGVRSHRGRPGRRPQSRPTSRLASNVLRAHLNTDDFEAIECIGDDSASRAPSWPANGLLAMIRDDWGRLWALGALFAVRGLAVELGPRWRLSLEV